VTKTKSSAKISSIIATSFALTADWYTASNRATVCSSTARGGFGSSNGRADRGRRELSDSAGVGTLAFRAGCLACCSDGGLATRFASRVPVSGGTAFCGFSALGDGVCSGTGSDRVGISVDARVAVSGGTAVCGFSTLDDRVRSGAGSDGVGISVEARVAVSGGTAVCGSSTPGDGLSSGVGVGVARVEARSGVSTMIGCENGVGVCSAVGVALSCAVCVRVAFWRRLGRFVRLTDVSCDLFPFPSAEATAPWNLPRTIVPE